MSADDKSQFLKECIVDATFNLMKKKHIDKITVDDIIERAGVGRTTYYRHFTNKTEIIFYKLGKMYDDYFDNLPPAEKPRTTEEEKLELLKSIYCYKDIYAIIYRQNPLLILTRFSSQATPDAGNTTDDIYKTSFYINGFFGVVCKWCERDFAETPEQLFEFMREWDL